MNARVFILVALMLAACGGGDYDDEREHLPTKPCKEKAQ